MIRVHYNGRIVVLLSLILTNCILFSRLRFLTHRRASSAFYACDLQRSLLFLVFILDIDNDTW